MSGSRRALIQRLALWGLPLVMLAGCGPASSPSGPPPTAAEIEASIRKTWEKPAPSGQDGAQTVEIKSIAVGAPRKWGPLDGGGGDPDADLYPAKVHWLLRTHYRTRTHVVERESVFSVFRNSFGEWGAGLSSELGQTQKTYDEPSTMP